MDSKESIFISHAAEDYKLAAAWQELVRTISNGKQVPWYASDKKVGGGNTTEQWRKKITKKLSNASYIMVILTPASNQRVWLGFESGMALGQKKKLIPITHFMEQEAAHSIFRDHPVYSGRDQQDVYKVLELTVFDGEDVPQESKEAWNFAYEKYLQEMSQERLATFTRKLFQDHFHNFEQSKKLEGVWAATWTGQDADGDDFLEEDALYIWSTETRVRMVGINAKKGIEEIMPSESGFYPMEGVVSGEGRIALSYWSAGGIPICGTCLLQKKGSTGQKFVGRWQGYTTADLSLDEDPKFTDGKVEFLRISKEMIPPEEVHEILTRKKRDGGTG